MLVCLCSGRRDGQGRRRRDGRRTRCRIHPATVPSQTRIRCGMNSVMADKSSSAQHSPRPGIAEPRYRRVPDPVSPSQNREDCVTGSREVTRWVRCHLRGIREACREPWRMSMENEALVYSVDNGWLRNGGHLSRGGVMLARR
jgi:hypothetical protein